MGVLPLPSKKEKGREICARQTYKWKGVAFARVAGGVETALGFWRFGANGASREDDPCDESGEETSEGEEVHEDEKVRWLS